MSKVLKIKRGELSKNFPMPKPAKKGDVGIDIPVALAPENDPIIIRPGERQLLPTDIKLEIPEGYWVAVEARSSTSKRSLIVPKGVIDEGYRGEIFAQIVNVGTESAVIHNGDKLVQLILHKNETNDLIIEETDELSATERGESGFGSSGKSVIG